MAGWRDFSPKQNPIGKYFHYKLKLACLAVTLPLRRMLVREDCETTIYYYNRG